MKTILKIILVIGLIILTIVALMYYPQFECDCEFWDTDCFCNATISFEGNNTWYPLNNTTIQIYSYVDTWKPIQGDLNEMD